MADIFDAEAAEEASLPLAAAIAASALSRVARIDVASVEFRSSNSEPETSPSPFLSNFFVTKLSLAVK